MNPATAMQFDFRVISSSGWLTSAIRTYAHHNSQHDIGPPTVITPLIFFAAPAVSDVIGFQRRTERCRPTLKKCFKNIYTNTKTTINKTCFISTAFTIRPFSFQISNNFFSFHPKGMRCPSVTFPSVSKKRPPPLYFEQLGEKMNRFLIILMHRITRKFNIVKCKSSYVYSECITVIII